VRETAFECHDPAGEDALARQTDLDPLAELEPVAGEQRVVVDWPLRRPQLPKVSSLCASPSLRFSTRKSLSAAARSSAGRPSIASAGRALWRGIATSGMAAFPSSGSVSKQPQGALSPFELEALHFGRSRRRRVAGGFGGSGRRWCGGRAGCRQDFEFLDHDAHGRPLNR
jgi:hypothetical protein